MKELASRYNPHGLEEKWYKYWEENQLFSFKFHEDHQQREKFSMVIPPPNVTGSLHLGHALNHTIQDILARYHRMKGLLCFMASWDRPRRDCHSKRSGKAHAQRGQNKTRYGAGKI